MTKPDLLDEFTVAYRARLEENRPSLELWAALVKGTDFADHPVDLDHLAATLNRSTPDTLELLRQWGGDAVRVHDGRVHLHLTFPDRPTGFRIQLGGRTLNTNAGGCAGDTVAVMLWTGKPVRVETTCPTTGTPIRVELDPAGTSTVEPATAVITVADPHSPRFTQIRDRRTASELICSQQNYYASPQAAADDPTLDPGVRVFPVGEFLTWIRNLGVHKHLSIADFTGWSAARPRRGVRSDRPTRPVWSRTARRALWDRRPAAPG